jgi:CubicO group peptidase (beta-lactamase class C family)
MSRSPVAVHALLALGSFAHLAAAPDVAAQLTAPRETGTAVAIPRERIEAVERFVERSWSRLGLPGVAVSVATGDSVLLHTGYGTGTMAGEAITGRVPIHIGSVTKTLTAAAAVHLAHHGALDLDAPVEAYVADFAMGGSFEAGTITVRHLLQHRSGLRQWEGHDQRAQREGTFDHLSPSGPPGERAEYSSLNFIVLGRILEAVTGKGYGRILDEALFVPLGMADAFVESDGDPPIRRARGHQSYFGFQRSRAEPSPPRYLVPAGFVGASAHDLGRYGGVLVGGGVFAGTRILDEETVSAILGPLDGPGPALGWGRRRVDGALLVEHKGNARTTSARMRLVPEQGYAIAVLTTTNSGPFFGAADDLMDGIHAILAGNPAPRLWPRERIFKGVILLSTALSVAGMIRYADRWSDAGYPVGVDGSAGVIGRLALDVGGGAILLFGVPRFVGVPLSTMVEYFPDLGLALAVSAGAGIAGGVFRAFTRSASGAARPQP